MKIYWNGKSKNIIGSRVRKLRQENGLTQKQLAEKLQLQGYEFSDLTILRIEAGNRFVADYEVKALAGCFGITADALLDEIENSPIDGRE
ncbi:MAG: helix-turn-helix domain-containing protein [Oscillospiraceae bacterium]|jgi:transcriptional regulator with XRE-family HTH domain